MGPKEFDAQALEDAILGNTSGAAKRAKTAVAEVPCTYDYAGGGGDDDWGYEPPAEMDPMTRYRDTAQSNCVMFYCEEWSADSAGAAIAEPASVYAFAFACV